MSGATRCAEVRLALLDYQRGRLSASTAGLLRAHLEQCAECARAEAGEQVLTSILGQRTPRYPASLALKRRLAEQAAAATPRRFRVSRWRPAVVPALAVAATLLLAVPLLYYERDATRAASARRAMIAEAVNDHLRVVTSQHPLDIESGGLHQVKPWFDGRLDFAPIVSFEGDEQFVLKGGAVGYFLDRKAAVLLYARRLHPITLLVFRAEGLDWPPPGLSATGVDSASAAVERGFNLIAWQRNGLAYALVSDLNATELKDLASRLMR